MKKPKKQMHSINGYRARRGEVAARATCPLFAACRQLGVTAREHEVCQWLMEGKSNADIARILQISPRTAEKHVHQVLKKLKVENRAAAGIELHRKVARGRI